MFPKDQLKTPEHRHGQSLHANWKIATGLPKVAAAEHISRRELRHPLRLAVRGQRFQGGRFHVEGKPHRIVFSGDGNYDMQRTAADVAKIVDEAYKIFGEFGYDNYTFIVNLRGGGGLEHLNSTALQYDRFGFKPESRYKDFLGLAAHEYFHNFNVKRIRPDALGPFDYENENYTRMLWVAEGGTEYYSNLLLRRAGFITDKEYLEAQGERRSGSLTAQPGQV